MSDNPTPDAWPQQPPAPSSGVPASGGPAQPYQPPAYQPTPYEPPAPYQPPAYQPPSYQSPTSGAPAQPPTDPYQPTAPYPGSTPAQPPTTEPYPAAPYGQTPSYPPPAYGQQTIMDPSATPSYPDYAAGSAMPSYPNYQTGPQSASPWGTPPPKKSRTGLFIGIAAAVVVVLVLCGVGIFALAHNSKKTKTTTSSGGTGGSGTATGTNPKPPTIALGDGAALKAHIIPLPSGADRESVTNSSNGVETLDQFITNAFGGDADEKDLLKQRDFKIAAEQWWTKGDIEVHIQLIQFGAESGASDYVSGQHGAYLDESDVTANYPLSGVDNGYGYEKSALDDLDNRRAILMCQVDNIVVVEFYYTPKSFDRPGELAFVQQQVAALGG